MYATPNASYSVMDSPVNLNRNNNTETTTISESLTSIIPAGGGHRFSPILYSFGTAKQLGIANIVITGYIPGVHNGIADIQVARAAVNAPIYNMVGQRVVRNTKGIIISNRRKYINL